MRYEILAPMLTMPKLMAIGDADTPADAVRIGREFVQQGQKQIQIGDTKTEEQVGLEAFAAKHGIR